MLNSFVFMMKAMRWVAFFLSHNSALGSLYALLKLPPNCFMAVVIPSLAVVLNDGDVFKRCAKMSIGVVIVVWLILSKKKMMIVNVLYW